VLVAISSLPVGIRRWCARALTSVILGLAVLLCAASSALALSWSAPFSDGTIANVTGLSCPTTTLCVAVDSTADAIVSTNPTGGAAAWNLDFDVDTTSGSPGLVGVSCVSSPSLLCVGADEWDGVVTTTDPTGGSSAWTTTVPPDSGLAGAGGATFGWGVSCASSALCAEAGDDDDGPDNDTGAEVFSSTNPTGGSGAWTRTFVTGDPGYMGATLYSISCPSTSLCVAGDDDNHILTASNPTGTWTPTTITDPDNSGAAFIGLSCASTSLCVAVDGDGNVITSAAPTGGASNWTVTSVDPGNELSAVSCTDIPSVLCAATDTAGNVVTSTDPTGGPSAWTLTNIDTLNTSLKAVSCATSSLCVVGDGAGNLITTQGPATGPTPTPTPTTETLSVRRAGTGTGKVTSSPPGIDCGSACSASFAQGTSVKLTATAASGSTFAGWSGATCKGTAACTVTLGAATTVTATFTAKSATTPPAIKRLSLVEEKTPAKHGFSLHVTLSAAGQLDIRVSLKKRAHGHTVLKLIGLVTERGRKGANTFGVTSVHGHKLKPGTYELAVDTVSGKKSSKTVDLTVTLTG
jgi:Divergent InlB B-repeat domain